MWFRQRHPFILSRTFMPYFSHYEKGCGLQLGVLVSRQNSDTSEGVSGNPISPQHYRTFFFLTLPWMSPFWPVCSSGCWRQVSPGQGPLMIIMLPSHVQVSSMSAASTSSVHRSGQGWHHSDPPIPAFEDWTERNTDVWPRYEFWKHVLVSSGYGTRVETGLPFSWN